MLDKKKNRHASIPNPNNQMAVEDIKRVQEAAREKQATGIYALQYGGSRICRCRPAKCTNHLENAFGRIRSISASGRTTN